jgi:hypothetical protein
VRRGTLGTFPVRFPCPTLPGDTGWHVDTSFPPETGDSSDFLSWRVNVASKGRALLMLFLFSGIGESDALTRIRAGSHLDVARLLALAGAAGLSLIELAANGFEETAARPEVLATGEAGTVYLCHPFLVHAAQPRRGVLPAIGTFIAGPCRLGRGADPQDGSGGSLSVGAMVQGCPGRLFPVVYGRRLPKSGITDLCPWTPGTSGSSVAVVNGDTGR